MTPLEAEAAEAMAVEVLKAGHPVRFVARGRSMWPFVLDGDVLTIMPINGALHCGDLVWIEGGPVHRVMAITSGPRYWIRGDALPRPDGGYRAEELLGRVHEIRRSGRPVPLRSSIMTVGMATLLGWARVIGQIVRR